MYWSFCFKAFARSLRYLTRNEMALQKCLPMRIDVLFLEVSSLNMKFCGFNFLYLLSKVTYSSFELIHSHYIFSCYIFLDPGLHPGSNPCSFLRHINLLSKTIYSYPHFSAVSPNSLVAIGPKI